MKSIGIEVNFPEKFDLNKENLGFVGLILHENPGLCTCVDSLVPVNSYVRFIVLNHF